MHALRPAAEAASPLYTSAPAVDDGLHAEAIDMWSHGLEVVVGPPLPQTLPTACLSAQLHLEVAEIREAMMVRAARPRLQLVLTAAVRTLVHAHALTVDGVPIWHALSHIELELLAAGLQLCVGITPWGCAIAQ